MKPKHAQKHPKRLIKSLKHFLKNSIDISFRKTFFAKIIAFKV